MLVNANVDVYKKFNQYFLKITNKLNTKVKKANVDIKKKKNFKSVRDTVKKEVEFDKIDPFEIATEMKGVVEKLNLKSLTADSEIYEYVILTLLDVM
jgi:hypothetical protein